MLWRIEDWDDAYANGPNIPNGDSWPDRWVEQAARFRETMQSAGRVRFDIAYGDAPRNRYDLFLPEAQPAGLVVFVHGGFWRRFDKSVWSHFAAGPLGRGYAVAMPSYTLAPHARIRTMTTEIAAMLVHGAEAIDGPIFLTGHSAGGHLASRMLCADVVLPDAIRNRIRHVVSISGVHDLRPIMRTELNDTLHIDAEEARAESPVLCDPVENARLTCWVGAGERSEFIRLNALLANVWKGCGAATLTVEEPDRHHFDVIDGLTEPESALVNHLLNPDAS
ncbi:MAG: alpha/beta hydrolase [Pseudomonadota bacterium]